MKKFISTSFVMVFGIAFVGWHTSPPAAWGSEGVIVLPDERHRFTEMGIDGGEHDITSAQTVLRGSLSPANAVPMFSGLDEACGETQANLLITHYAPGGSVLWQQQECEVLARGCDGRFEIGLDGSIDQLGHLEVGVCNPGEICAANGQAACGASPVFTLSGAEAAAASTVPGQYIAKLYSEALGRAPDPSGWSGAVGSFGSCTRARLKSLGQSVFSSSEYTSRGYDNTEKVLTAYRTILNREPDSSGFAGWKAYLDSGNPFSTMISLFYDSSEFGSLVSAICSGAYGWGSHPAIAIGAKGTGFSGGTATALQSLLDSAPAGGTVFLAQRAVVFADRQIVVPSGKTLATTGYPDRYNYARMGRIVRTTLTTKEVIRLHNGAKLRSVWVSGQRPVVGVDQRAPNIFIPSGSGTRIEDVRSDTPAGWTNIALMGRRETGVSCANVLITRCLTTGYSSAHTTTIPNCGDSFRCPWSDGISDACEGSTVTFNHIVDPTDVAIVMFRSDPAIQQSLIRDNVSVSAGLSAYGAYVVDPLSGGSSPDYAGSLMTNNTFFAAPKAHIDIGLSIGTMPWFFAVGGAIGRNATVTGQSTSGIFTNMDSGIVVDGMLTCTVTGNSLTRAGVETISCPTGNVFAHTPTHASGTIQPFAVGASHACVGH